jgi:hypothetical protein
MDLLEASAIDDRKCKGRALIACGHVLLWTDLLIILTIGSVGVRTGSSFWTWWVVIEAVAGFVLLALGGHFRGHVYE